MSETKKPKRTKKPIIDVKQPGTSAPPETSKPVIVTNRPLLRDPMMAEPTDKDKKSEEPSQTVDDQSATMLDPGQKPALQPLNKGSKEQDNDNSDETISGEADPNSETKEDKGNPAAEAPQNDSTDEEQPPESIASESTPNEDESEQTTPLDAKEKSATSQQNDEETASESPKQAGPKQAEAEAAAKTKHDAEIQELIDSKRYVLPIDTVEKRKSKRFVLLGAALAVVLIIIWLDIALDAGIIRLGGLKPLTHFFSN